MKSKKRVQDCVRNERYSTSNLIPKLIVLKFSIRFDRIFNFIEHVRLLGPRGSNWRDYLNRKIIDGDFNRAGYHFHLCLSLSPFSNELSKFGAVIDITRSFRNKVFRLVRISNEPTRRATGTRKFA